MPDSHVLSKDCPCGPTVQYIPPDLVLRLSPMERDMLLAICDEGIEDWNDQTAVGLRRKVLALATTPTSGPVDEGGMG